MLEFSVVMGTLAVFSVLRYSSTGSRSRVEIAEEVVASKDIDLIVPNLYLGSMIIAQDYSVLKALNITHVLMVLPMMEPPFPHKGIIYKQFLVGDNPMTMIGKYFDEAIEFIDMSLAKNGSILVHCARGASRSAAIVCAYLIRKNGWDFETAAAFLKEKRSVVAINPGFQTQLSLFQHVVVQARTPLDKYLWADRLNQISSNFLEGEKVEFWHTERQCWVKGTFLSCQNHLFSIRDDEALQLDSVATSNLGLVRRPFQSLEQNQTT